jgi:hypothetical protein
MIMPALNSIRTNRTIAIRRRSDVLIDLDYGGFWLNTPGSEKTPSEGFPGAKRSTRPVLTL